MNIRCRILVMLLCVFSVLSHLNLVKAQSRFDDQKLIPEAFFGERVVGLVNIDLEKVTDPQWKTLVGQIWPQKALFDQRWPLVISLLRERDQSKATQLAVLFRSFDAQGNGLSPVLLIKSKEKGEFKATIATYRLLFEIPESKELSTERAGQWTLVYPKDQALEVPQGMNLQFRIFRSLMIKRSDSPIRLFVSSDFPLKSRSVKRFENGYPLNEKTPLWKQLVQLMLDDFSRNELMVAELQLGEQLKLVGEMHVKDQERAVYVHHDQANFLDRLKAQALKAPAGMRQAIHLISEACFYESDKDQLHFTFDAEAITTLVALKEGRLNATSPLTSPATQPSESYVERMKSNDRKIQAGVEKIKLPKGVAKVAIDTNLTPAERSKRSAIQMRELLTLIITYVHMNEKQMPNSLEDLSTIVDHRWKSLAINPSTGDSPGYLYVKPEKKYADITSTSKVPVLYETRDGKKLEGGWVGYLNGSIRRDKQKKE